PPSLRPSFRKSIRETPFSLSSRRSSKSPRRFAKLQNTTFSVTNAASRERLAFGVQRSTFGRRRARTLSGRICSVKRGSGLSRFAGGLKNQGGTLRRGGQR